MAGIPFFRGQNRMDWLVGLLMQVAADWGTPADIIKAAAPLGPSEAAKFYPPDASLPPVSTCYTQDFGFVLCGSTRGALQWIGNVLGSPARGMEGITGETSTYFGNVARSHYGAVLNDITSKLGNRSLVLVGFSLGGASACIQKELWQNLSGQASACLAFASPRAGTVDFVGSYPGSNFSAVVVTGDAVPSVPPLIWAANPVSNSWVPTSPFVAYSAPIPAYQLALDGSLSSGYDDLPVVDVIAAVSSGEAAQLHDQALYARLIRSGLPGSIPDGYEDYPFASQLDKAAPDLLSWDQSPWPWPDPPDTGDVQLAIATTPEVFCMGCAMGIFIRDKGKQKGFEEVYYFPTDDPVGLRSTSNANGWLTLRSKFLSDVCEIYAARWSHVGSPKGSTAYRPAAPLSGQIHQQGMATIEDCIILQGFTTDGKHKRTFHFRGIDANYLSDDNLTGAGQTACQLIYGAFGQPTANTGSFLGSMQQQTLSIHSRLGGPPGPYAISGATKATGSDPITLTLATTDVIAPNSLWELKGCRGTPLLNGIYQAIGASPAGQIVLSGTFRYGLGPSVSGTLTLIADSFLPITSYAVLGGGKKNTGKPPFGPRGRQSPALKRR